MVVVSVGMVAGLEYSASILPHIIRGVSLLGVSSSNYPIEREDLWNEISEAYNLEFLNEIECHE